MRIDAGSQRTNRLLMRHSCSGPPERAFINLNAHESRTTKNDHRRQHHRNRNRRSASAWSAAARAPSSARSTASPRAWTTATNSSPVRCPPIRKRARDGARDLDIAPDRAYASFAEMAAAEAKRADRIDAVSIVTPNHLHCAGRQSVPRGRHPRHLRQAAHHDARRRAGACASSCAKPAWSSRVTHNYTGYPLVRQAREMVPPANSARSASSRSNTRRTG